MFLGFFLDHCQLFGYIGLISTQFMLLFSFNFFIQYFPELKTTQFGLFLTMKFVVYVALRFFGILAHQM